MEQRQFGRALSILDIYVGPLLLLGLALVLFILTVTTPFPEPANLSEVRGHLDSYYFNQTGRGRGDYTTIIALQDGNRFWTHAINKDNAESILKERGLEVRYYVDTHSRDVPMDGAIKAYGLWIDGRQVQSSDEAINDDKVAVHYYFPAIGIFAIVAAVFIHRRNKVKYSRGA